MLQQTQVSRVSEKYREFLEVFPTVRALARASLLDVLKVWSGLGYNRRAKYLHDAAKIIVEKYKGETPAVYSELVELPGVGEYTAKAVLAFAFNKPDVLIETNIRTALIHTFFWGRARVTDHQLVTLLSKVIDEQRSREWHWALMDYGAYLKCAGVRNNHRSAHYVRQSIFEGSLRQVRGAILRALVRGGSISDPRGHYSQNRKYSQALRSLKKEGILIQNGGLWKIK